MARTLERDRGLTFVHPFDDEFVAAGQGTAGLELLEQARESRRRRRSDRRRRTDRGNARRDQGVEPVDSRLWRRADGRRGDAPQSRRWARAAARLGEHDRRRSRRADGGRPHVRRRARYVDDVVLIDDDTIVDAIRELLVSAKILAEGGGAAATAAVLTRAIPLRDGERVAAIVSGGNIDAARLAKMLG